MSADRFERDPYPDGAPHNATDTSVAAARAQKGCSQRDRQRVYDHIIKATMFGVTDDEGHRQIGMNHYTYAPRRRELAMDGHVFDTGMRRDTQLGHTAIVWRARVYEDGKLPARKKRKPLKKHAQKFIDICLEGCKYWPEELKAKLRAALDNYQGDGNDWRR